MDRDDLPGRREEKEGQQPVAYDADGRPLYAAPPSDASYNQQPGPQFVHLARAADPMQPVISDELKAKHDASVRAFPSLNLSEVEYIISAVPRHTIGVMKSLVGSGIAVLVIALVVFNYNFIMSSFGTTKLAPPFWLVLLSGIILTAVIAIACYGAVWVFNSNKFFLTNESVIQEIQEGFFAHREQTISLANIEDASYTQIGPLQMIFNYGTIRLSTEGEETTYTFTYASNPKRQIAVLNNAVEDFKNGRPVNYRGE